MSLGVRRSDRHDVVFYAPWVGSILAGGGSLPPGGAETQVWLLSRQLAAMGARVAVVVFGSPEELPTEIEGVRIVARPPRITGQGVRGKLIEASRTLRSLSRAPSRTIVYRSASVEVALIALYAKATGRRLVYSSACVGDFDARQVIPKRSHASIFEYAARRSYEIVVQTEEQVELCRAAFDRDPRLIKSIAPLAERQEGVPEAFLWVGRLSAQKGPMEFVGLARALPEARFRMVGVPASGPENERLASAVSAEAGMLDNLELLPPRPHAEIQALVSGAVATVNTAPFEGMPNALLEGWCQGVPALVLNHDPGGVIRDHGLGGFAGGSFETLVALAREQWRTRGDRIELSRRCRRYIAENHAPKAVGRQWLDLLSVSPSEDGAATTEGELETTCAA